jgi:hypothetical protein
MERSRLKHPFLCFYLVRTDEKFGVPQSAIQHSAIPPSTNMLVPVLIFPGTLRSALSSAQGQAQPRAILANLLYYASGVSSFTSC